MSKSRKSYLRSLNRERFVVLMIRIIWLISFEHVDTKWINPLLVITIHILICWPWWNKEKYWPAPPCRQWHTTIISQKTFVSWLHWAYRSRSSVSRGVHAYFICFILCFIFLRARLPRGPDFLLWWCQSSCLINRATLEKLQPLSCLPAWLHVQRVGGFHRNTCIESMRTARGIKRRPRRRAQWFSTMEHHSISENTSWPKRNDRCSLAFEFTDRPHTGSMRAIWCAVWVCLI